MTNSYNTLEDASWGPAKTIASFFKQSEAIASVTDLFAYAEALHEVGRLRKALEITDLLTGRALSKASLCLVLILKSHILRELAQPIESERELRTACDLDVSVYPYIRLAEFQRERQRFSDSLETLSIAENKCSNNDEDTACAISYTRAVNFISLSRLDDAKTLLEQILHTSSRSDQIREILIDINNALSGQLQGLESGPISIVQIHNSSQNKLSLSNRQSYCYADALHQINRFDEALEECARLKEKLINKISGVNAHVLVLEGRIWTSLRQYKLAEDAFRKALILDDSTVSYVYLAGALARQECFAEAIQVLEKALLINGDTDEVLLNIALNRRAMGQLLEAKVSLELALLLTPDYTEAKEVLNDISAALE